MAAPPLDLPCDGPVTYPGDIKTLRIRSKGRSGPSLKITDLKKLKSILQLAWTLFTSKRGTRIRFMTFGISAMVFCSPSNDPWG